MKQKYNIKTWLTGLFVLLLTLGMGLNAQAQTEIFNEELRNGSLPTGWSQVDVTFATAADGYANFTSTSAELESPEFDGSSYGSIDVEFEVAKFGSGGDGPITVEYSTNGGTDWIKAGDSGTPTNATYVTDHNPIVINSVSSTMVIRFTRPDSPSQKRLRDVVITGNAAAGTPVLSANPTSISSLDYGTVVGGPSASQSFTITGSDLDPADATVTVTAPSNFEVSLNDADFGASVTADAAGGTLAETTVYTRLVSGLSAGDYSGDITVSGGTATDALISLSGTVTAPLSAALPYEEAFATDLSGVLIVDVQGNNTWTQGSADSRTYARANGFNTGLTEETWLILPGFDFTGTGDETMRFETSYNFGTDDADNFLKLVYSTDYPGVGDPTASTWTELTFDRPGSGGHSITPSGNVDLTGIDAASVYIAFQYNYEVGNYREWRLYDLEIFEGGSPELTLSVSTLSDLDYVEGSGPSASKSFSLLGSSLDGTDVIITAPTNYEVSLDDETFAPTRTLPAYDGTATDVFVRLVADLIPNTYSGNVEVTGGGTAGSTDVAVSGEVTGPPPAVAVLDADGYEEDFTGFEGAGFSAAPVAGQLNSSNWRITGMSDGSGDFDGEHTTGDFARGLSTGGVNTGGTYAFNAGDGITVLGVQGAGSDFTPGTMTLRLTNTTGDVINNISVSYDIYVYNDQGRSSSFNFAYSTDDATYTDVGDLDYTTPEAADAEPAWVRVERSTTISGLGILNGDTIYLQWKSDDVSGGGSRDEFGLTNVTATALTGAVITGSAGWRILSDPTTATLSQFLDPIWTQGLPGSDYPTGVNDPEANVITINTLTGAYQDLPSLGQSSPAGSGFGVYVYDEDVFGDPTTNNWPKVLPTSTEDYDSPVVVDEFMGVPLLGVNPNSFALVGNPFLSDISWDIIEGDGGLVGLQNAIYLQDHTVGAEGDWISYVGGVGDLPAGGVLAAFQGFAIQSSAAVEARSLTFTDAAITSGGSLLSAPEFDALVNLKLNYEDKSVSNWIRISETGSMERSSNDAIRLTPFSSNYMVLATEKQDGTILSIGDFPSHEQSLLIPLHVESTIGGSHSITVADLNVNPNWTLKLQDTLTGEVVDITSDFEYTFELEAINTTSSDVSITEKSLAPVMLENDSPRFIVIANAGTTSAPINNELPNVLALNQNYPNPFNPTTQISYDLPESADVRLEVYNIQGQKVATLVNNTMNAGSHTVSFDAANLASGVYLYRLQVGSQVLTKKMTLLK